jgi:hypothetical protein
VKLFCAIANAICWVGTEPPGTGTLKILFHYIAFPWEEASLLAREREMSNWFSWWDCLRMLFGPIFSIFIYFPVLVSDWCPIHHNCYCIFSCYLPSAYLKYLYEMWYYCYLNWNNVFILARLRTNPSMNQDSIWCSFFSPGLTGLKELYIMASLRNFLFCTDFFFLHSVHIYWRVDFILL